MWLYAPGIQTWCPALPLPFTCSSPVAGAEQQRHGLSWLFGIVAPSSSPPGLPRPAPSALL